MIIPHIYALAYRLHRALAKYFLKLSLFHSQAMAIGYCLSHRVKLDYKNTEFIGMPVLEISKRANVTIEPGFSCRSGRHSRSIDNRGFSKIAVEEGATLTIGEHSGMSNTCIYCAQEITIGKYVNIGAGSMIFDTDFHSLSWEDRRNGADWEKRRKKPVRIGDDVFIGAECLILKGVTIGNKAIIGAGSVVTCDIPEGEIWAGHPARFVRKL